MVAQEGAALMTKTMLSTGLYMGSRATQCMENIHHLLTQNHTQNFSELVNALHKGANTAKRKNSSREKN